MFAARKGHSTPRSSTSVLHGMATVVQPLYPRMATPRSNYYALLRGARARRHASTSAREIASTHAPVGELQAKAQPLQTLATSVAAAAAIRAWRRMDPDPGVNKRRERVSGGTMLPTRSVCRAASETGVRSHLVDRPRHPDAVKPAWVHGSWQSVPVPCCLALGCSIAPRAGGHVSSADQKAEDRC
jgi:hypothetical protein